MKKIVLLIVSVLLISISFAQNNAGKAVVDSKKFQKIISQIKFENNTNLKFKKAMKYAKREFFTCSQIRDVSRLLEEDKQRLKFSLKAYERTVNPKNYYPIMDGFMNMSTAFKFYDRKRYMPNSTDLQTGAVQYPISSIKPEIIEFPDASEYNGFVQSDCKLPIPVHQFTKLKQSVVNIKSEAGRYNRCVNIAEENCLSVSHIMQLGLLLNQEQSRYNLLKETHSYLYDIGNIHSSMQLFSSSDYQQKVSGLFQPPMTETPSPQTTTQQFSNPCGVDERELQEMISFVKEQSFESDKISVSKTIIKQKQCLTSQQIGRLIEVFDYDSSKLDIAKFAFPYATDKTNYYKLGKKLEFKSNRDSLLEFINNQ